MKLEYFLKVNERANENTSSGVEARNKTMNTRIKKKKKNFPRQRQVEEEKHKHVLLFLAILKSVDTLGWPVRLKPRVGLVILHRITVIAY